MHELPVIKQIMGVCLKHAAVNQVRRIVIIELRVGEMSDLEPEWMQRYFDYLSKGTIAEGAKLRIEKVPVVLRCIECENEYQINIKAQDEHKCPTCGNRESEMISGKEYFISNMEVL